METCEYSLPCESKCIFSNWCLCESKGSWKIYPFIYSLNRRLIQITLCPCFFCSANRRASVRKKEKQKKKRSKKLSKQNKKLKGKECPWFMLSSSRVHTNDYLKLNSVEQWWWWKIRQTLAATSGWSQGIWALTWQTILSSGMPDKSDISMVTWWQNCIREFLPALKDYEALQ